MKKIAIIGSFQRRDNYQKVLQIIESATSEGLTVVSPQGSSVKCNRDGFVIFESDNVELSNEKIQNITLEKIFSADAVYVVNSEGYLGRTTCYEIGRLIEKNIPIYFYQKPEDLPICVFKDSILSPNFFFKKVINEPLCPLLKTCSCCNKLQCSTS